MSCYSWQHDGELPSLESNSSVSKRELFSVCGKLTGHFPVAGWLRVACSFMKRLTQSDMWDGVVSDHVQKMLLETLDKVAKYDPVKEKWLVATTDTGTVCCDASSLAIGVSVKIDGQIVEDAS